MSRIRIKNFGPIKDGNKENDGWIDIKKVTLFIGNQGSGKSTVAKLISTLNWSEKAMVKGTMRPDSLNLYNRFKRQCNYHNIGGYFKPDTYIEYEGEARHFIFSEGRFTSKALPNKQYFLPKIMYVPAERNFLAAIEQAERIKYLPSSLVTFQDEYRRSERKLKEAIELPINQTSLFVANGIPYIKGYDYEVKLSEASSGFQSAVPMFLVSRDLAYLIKEGEDSSTREFSSEEIKKLRADIERILLNDKLAQQVKDESLRVLSSKIKLECFINIVEEPEQNLFPSSQKQMLESLLELNNLNDENKLILTTHSPYLIMYLTLAVKAFSVLNEIDKSAHADKDSLLHELNEIVSSKAIVSTDDFTIYQLDETTGEIMHLGNYNGLPSDENYLNEKMGGTNRMYVGLLKIQDKCRTSS